MHKEFLMGNAAIAMGAVAAGVDLASGYPGTPSTEVLENTAKLRPEGVYVEWSVNEKAALEVAAGASYAGARCLVTMKQMGLNVASDPLMTLEYIGVKGGVVILVADDPGPISSQTEQDTRRYASFSKLPCFDPSSVKEAYEMAFEAFEFSEKYGTPVILRPTTRICHAYASIDVRDESEYVTHKPEGFIKDSKRFVIFPRLSFKNHGNIVKRNDELSEVFSNDPRNILTPPGKNSKKGIAAGGISYAHLMEALKDIPDDDKPSVLKISTPHPFPYSLSERFMRDRDEVLVLEELEPVIEDELLKTAGKYYLSTKVSGKHTGDVRAAGENSIDDVFSYVSKFIGIKPLEEPSDVLSDAPSLPVRPPVLCAGCPHRASFYAVKRAMKGKKTVFGGDIGCYTLGNAMPLDMVDSCLCMGAGITIPQGIGHIEPDTRCFGFVGDSTFFASGITGIVNAVYNQSEMTVIILDNSTTAMTGHQPHPGTGHTLMGDVVEKVDIEKVLRGVGVTHVETVDPLDLDKAIEAVKRADSKKGVKAIIFRSPCVALIRKGRALKIDENKCIRCKKCIKEIGCPALSVEDGRIVIDGSLCNGCSLCERICPTGAIKKEADHE
ncbi:MAG: indolepyruvate ferredoxin oxidoreductase subunit alpha [Clostridiales bacterium]|nr:indolepyruvate ferredoxin oxidoreductase subunit alpha [Clostridiales bacterium]